MASSVLNESKKKLHPKSIWVCKTYSIPNFSKINKLRLNIFYIINLNFNQKTMKKKKFFFCFCFKSNAIFLFV